MLTLAPRTLLALPVSSGAAYSESPVSGKTALAYRPSHSDPATDGTESPAFTPRTYAHLADGPRQFADPVRHPDTRSGAATLAGDIAAVHLPSAPWLTPWALAGNVGLGVLGVLGLVRLTNRRLRSHTGRLKLLLAERTAQLARRNTELALHLQIALHEKNTAREAAERTHLQMLRYQLNPHFLFNTLSSIRMALPSGSSPARGMVDHLIQFCHLTLRVTDDGDWTSLGHELRLLRSYLAIEQSRWGELLSVELIADPALEHERLPQFLLLPLVENALKYGRATSPDRVGLSVSALREPDGTLLVAIANTGEWIEPGHPRDVASLGIGLDNLRARLARHYPGRHEFLTVPSAGWVTVRLRLVPAQDAPPYRLPCSAPF